MSEEQPKTAEPEVPPEPRRRGLPLSQFCPKAVALGKKIEGWEKASRESKTLYGPSDPRF